MQHFDHKSFSILKPTGEIRYCSLEFAHIFSRTPDELIGRLITTFLRPENVLSNRKWFHQDTGQEYKRGLLSETKTKLRYRLTLMDDGAVLFLYEDIDPLTLQMDELYSRAFHLNPGLSAITVLKTGKHLDVNNAWLTAMGYTRDEVIGKTSRELNIWQRGEDERREIIGQLLKKEKLQNFQAKMRTKEGDLLDILVSAEIIEYKGHRLAFFASHNISRITKEIALRRSAEQELIKNSNYLEQANLALKSMLDHRETELRAIEENTFMNLRKYVLPYLEEIEQQGIPDSIQVLIQVMKTSVNQLMAPGADMFFSKYATLTPMEIKVADLVKQGMRTKEISEFLNIANSSVSTYRNNIRAKLGLKNSKKNLRVFLTTLKTGMP